MRKFSWIAAAFLLILAACGSSPTPTATPPPPTYSVSVSGAAAFQANNYTLVAQPDSGVISLDFANGTTGQIVQIFLEPEAQAGNVALVASTDAMNPNRKPLNGLWLLVQAADTSAGAEPVYFSKDPTGSVTLTARAGVISGTVTATLTSAEGTPLTVEATFANIPAR